MKSYTTHATRMPATQAVTRCTTHVTCINSFSTCDYVTLCPCDLPKAYV